MFSGAAAAIGFSGGCDLPPHARRAIGSAYVRRDGVIPPYGHDTDRAPYPFAKNAAFTTIMAAANAMSTAFVSFAARLSESFTPRAR